MSDQKKNKPRILMISVGTVTLLVLLLLSLRWYAVEHRDFLKWLNREEEMIYMPRFFEYLTLFLPVILMASVLTVIFRRRSAEYPLASQREKLWISLILFVLTYACILPIVKFGGLQVEIPSEVEDLPSTFVNLWDLSYKWFFVQVVPFSIWVSYHAVRAGEEKTAAAASEEACV